MGFSALGGQAAALRAGSCCPGVSVLDRKPQSGPTKYPLSACIVPVGWAVRWGSFRTKSVRKLVNRGVNLVCPWVCVCLPWRWRGRLAGQRVAPGQDFCSNSNAENARSCFVFQCLFKKKHPWRKLCPDQN